MNQIPFILTLWALLIGAVVLAILSRLALELF
jgi:hypothetical protein